MKPYIVNLTDNLIESEKLVREFEESRQLKGWDERRKKFIDNAQLLISSSVNEMKSETLGKILGNLTDGEVLASQKELLADITYTGDCLSVLRHLVATALAYVIYWRLDANAEDRGFPLYRRKGV